MHVAQPKGGLKTGETNKKGISKHRQDEGYGDEKSDRKTIDDQHKIN